MIDRTSQIKEFSEGVIHSIAPTILLCKQHLGVSTFGYRRFLLDGKSFGFSDNLQWNQVFSQNFIAGHIPEYEKDFQKFIAFGENYLVRTGCPPQGNRFLEALYETNVWNTLVVYMKHPDNASVEAFFLGATRDDAHMAEIYTSKREFIQHLIKLFQIQLNECFTPEVNSYFSTTLTDPDCLKTLQHFLNLEKCPGQFSNNFLSLSNREREIVHLLIQGHKRRDIAAKLKISPKTVDANFEHIKTKTQTMSKMQFLKLVREPTIKEVLTRCESIYV